MTTTDIVPADLRDLAHREEIRRLVHRVGRCLDDHDFDGLRQLYAEDAVAQTPGGRAEGIDALVTQAQRSHTRTPAVQHLITDVLIELNLDVDRADVTANLLAIFIDDATPPAPVLQLGERYRFSARRGDDGWQLTSVTSKPVWMVDDRPDQAAASRG
ncbi:nuclear transport factor 2 family protein [Nitriliruptor alkaliphilus]|uniref:nuclear transport factor 2 family protein n=1 Tax=Nitriliruptor alkaliphilus TaxID=427918 RepID=UPI000697A240|nr:nuclear transport factor 2 family protein [Nitriliruptor alkaliphilus]